MTATALPTASVPGTGDPGTGDPSARIPGTSLPSTREVDLWRTLDRLQGVLSRNIHNRLAAYDLTRPQYQVLRRLVDQGRAASAALAAELGSTPGNLTGVLDRLEAAGLIVRERDAADRRCVWMTATPAAHALMARCVPDLRAHIQQDVFGPFNAQELDTALGFMQRLEAHLSSRHPAPQEQPHDPA